MINGVIIRMNNGASLSTVALLSLLWENEQRDYLDVLGQFVLRCAPKGIGTKVDIVAIVNKMRTDYDFEDIPSHVIEKVLRRLSRLNKQHMASESARPLRIFLSICKGISNAIR